MKLLELKIEGFRSLRNVVWKPGDLNVLVGPNAGGKSNLLKALELLSASACRELVTHISHAGGMGSLVWNGVATEIGLMASMGPQAFEEESIAQYGIRLGRIGPTSGFEIVAESFGSLPRSEKSLVFRREPGIVEFPNLAATDDQRLHDAASDADNPTTTILSQLARPVFRLNSYFAVAKCLMEWALFQYFRTDADASVRGPIVSRNQTIMAPDGQDLGNVLHTLYTSSPTFEQDINDAMSAAFGAQYDKLIFPPDTGDNRVQLQVRWSKPLRPAPATELSDGTLRFLYLLAILANPNPPPLIAIDEPEAGLHPSMLRIVAEFAGRAATRSQVILSTHSAELLDSLTEFKPTTHVVEAHNGETEIRTLAGEKLDYWLNKYSLGELYRTSGLEAAT